METLMPILFIIAMFVIQAIANYRKEQEKARNRDLGKPIPSVPAPLPVDESEPSFNKQALETERESSNVYAAYEGTLLADEAPQSRAQAGELKRFKPYEIAGPESSDTTYENDALEKFRKDFDMRDAVILSAILERPYK